MRFDSKKSQLIILGFMALLLSRGMFALFNNPKGPNLLVVVGMAGILYTLPLLVYVFGPQTKRYDLIFLGGMFFVEFLLSGFLYYLLVYIDTCGT